MSRLSSQTGDRSERSNRGVALQCLGNPELLTEIAEGLESDNAALAGDCAEVLTLVARERPELVALTEADLIGFVGNSGIPSSDLDTLEAALPDTLIIGP